MATRITVNLPDKEHAELAALAQKNDVSFSLLTREAIVELLHRHQKGSEPLALHVPSNNETGPE